MAQQPLSDELIPGLLDTGLVIAIAEPGSGKTFFGIHVGVHVATGAKWCGRRVRQGPVVYCIAEGVNYFTYRITTAFDFVGAAAAEAPFYVLPHSINLRSGDDGQITEELVELTTAIAALEESPRLIVFDTLNRYMPGGDENNQKDASALVRGCEYLQQTFGGTVMLMHHMRKGGDLARGSTVFTGAADQVIFAKKPKKSMTDAPVLWTTEGAGKRKDRDPVNQWFEFVQTPMTRGNKLSFNPESDSVDDLYVMKTAYDDDGNEYETHEVEETLVMQPCDPPEGQDTEDGRSVEAGELLNVAMKSPDGFRVRQTMELLGWNTRKFYKAVNELEADELIYKDEDSGKYFATVRKMGGNPFSPMVAG